MAALFYIRLNSLKDFIFLNENGKYTLTPKSGIISDEILKSIYENCKGAIEYIEKLVELCCLRNKEADVKYIVTYLGLFWWNVILGKTFNIKKEVLYITPKKYEI